MFLIHKIIFQQIMSNFALCVFNFDERFAIIFRKWKTHGDYIRRHVCRILHVLHAHQMFLHQIFLPVIYVRKHVIYVQKKVHVKHTEVLHVLGDRVRDPLLARVGEGRSGVAARDSEAIAVVGVAVSFT